MAPAPDFKATWLAILAKLTLDEKLVLNSFLKAHRQALVQIQNQKALLAQEQAEIIRLAALIDRTPTVGLPLPKTPLDGASKHVK